MVAIYFCYSMGDYQYDKLLTRKWACDLLNQIETAIPDDSIPDDYQLADQMRRAAYLVPAYIIESDSKGDSYEDMNCLYNAAAICGQLLVQLKVLRERSTRELTRLHQLEDGYQRLLMMLGKMITRLIEQGS